MEGMQGIQLATIGGYKKAMPKKQHSKTQPLCRERIQMLQGKQYQNEQEQHIPVG